MMFLGSIVNAATVIAGSSAGMLLGKGIPDRIANQIMKGLGLCTLAIGVAGAIKTNNEIVMILSMVIGILIGEAVDIDRHFTDFTEKIEKKFRKGEGRKSIAEGFITASLVFCIGSMTFVGSVNAGITGDQSMLYTKSTLDLISSFVFASSLGIGVLFASAFVLVFQGGITLLAHFAAALLSEAVIAEITCVGSLLIIGTGLNLLGITRLKLMNYMPAIFMPLILMQFLG